MEELFAAAVAAELALGKWLLAQTKFSLIEDTGQYKTYVVGDTDLRVTLDLHSNHMTAYRKDGYEMCAVCFPAPRNDLANTAVPWALLVRLGITTRLL